MEKIKTALRIWVLTSMKNHVSHLMFDKTATAGNKEDFYRDAFVNVLQCKHFS